MTGPPPRTERGGGPAGVAVLAALALATVLVGLWHLTQGTSGVGFGDLLGHLVGEEHTGGAPVGEIFTGSRLPRLFAGVAVGFALGCAGALLQSVTRNALASPDTLAVTAGAYFTLTLVAAFGLTVPLWASGAAAFAGGLVAAALVLLLAGRAAGTTGTRLVLAGSAIAMALDAATGMLLILFNQNTTGLFAWGSGSLAQLNIDASLRAFPLIALVVCVALALSRRLDVMNLGDDAASTLGVPIRTTRVIAVVCAVLLTGTAVTLAGPISFVGLGAPVLARLIAGRVHALSHHLLLVPAAGLLGALLILLADAVLRAVQGADGAAAIPTGVPTALLGAVVIVVLALRLRDTGQVRQPPAAAKVAARSRRGFLLVVSGSAVVLAGAALVAVLAGSLWLRTGDLALWISGTAPELIGQALDDRVPRVLAAVLAGAALGLAGCVVQGAVRNPLAEPGVLGITAGAGLGAAAVVTSGLPGGRPLLIVVAVAAGLATFAVIALLAWRGGFLPDRFVLIGIGCGYGLSSVTTFLLLRADPYNTPGSSPGSPAPPTDAPCPTSSRSPAPSRWPCRCCWPCAPGSTCSPSTRTPRASSASRWSGPGSPPWPSRRCSRRSAWSRSASSASWGWSPRTWPGPWWAPATADRSRSRCSSAPCWSVSPTPSAAPSSPPPSCPRA